jgi:two-component system LytT family response regulator
MKIRTLIVDDEELARVRIRELLAREDDVEVVGECGDGEEALAAVAALAPDLVFLDVQMPEMDGFEVLQALPAARAPVVVFVTAYDEFALRAFDAHAIDYLLKPVHPERFATALERVRALVSRARSLAVEERLDALLDSLGARRRWMERFVVRTGTRIHLVPAVDVDWIEAEGNYVRLHAGKRSHLLRAAMGTLSARLDPDRFLRIHRSLIVNVDRLREVHTYGKGSYVLVLADGTQLTSSTGYRVEVERLISDRV